jgi:lipopolysaccharide transport system ATP-binding protein
MVSIVLDNAGVAFTLYSGKYQSIRSRIVQSATAGQIGHDPSGRVAVKALEPTSLSIHAGERVGLMGPNGAGKSTLLRVVSKVYRPTTGIATIEGSIGTLIDISLGMNPEATGRQNIFLRAAMLGISRREIKRKFQNIAEFSELEDFLEMPVRTYSSGMQLRLSFAVSTILVPDILVMDEWLSVGDQSFKEKAENRLREIVEGSKMLVLASHDRKLLETTCSRGLVLDRGKVAFDGPISHATDRYFGPAE